MRGRRALGRRRAQALLGGGRRVAGCGGFEHQAVHMRTGALHARADDLAQQRHFLRPRGRIEIYQQLIGLGQVAQPRHMPSLARARAHRVPRAIDRARLLGSLHLRTALRGRSRQDALALCVQKATEGDRFALALVISTSHPCSPPWLDQAGHR